MTFQQFLLALRGRWKICVALLGATILAAFLVTLVMPKTYEAVTSVLVDAKDDQMINQPLGSPRQQLGYMQTQIDIIQSQRVAREVVQNMKLADNPNVKAAFVKSTGGHGDIVDWLAGALLHDLKVDSSQSSVILMRYTANDPKFAADVANAFAKAYVDVTLKLRVDPTKEAATWFNDQLKGLRNDLEAAQAKLAAFQREKGIIATDERMDIENTRLNELSNQALQASAQSIDSASKLGQSGRTSPGAVPEVIANPMIQGLKAELLRAESKLAEASTRLGPNHPQYQQQAAEVKALRERVNAEMANVIGGVKSATSSSYAREQALKRDLAEQRKKVEALRDARSQSIVLVRDVDTAQKAYDAALQRYLVNKVESGARSTNVTVLNAAPVPLLPLRPRLSVNLAVGVFVGLLLGLAAVFFLELLDRRVRSTGDLEIGVEAPLLGTLLPWHPSTILGGGETKALPSPT